MVSLADTADNPASAKLSKTDTGFNLEVKFWANNVDPDSPLKIKRISLDFGTEKLVHVLHPIETASPGKKYVEYKINLSIPKLEIVSSSNINGLKLHF